MKKSIVLAIVAFGFAVPCSAATLFFDFGDTGQPTPGNYNNISFVQDPILNAIDSTGASTGIGLTTEGFNEIGANLNGTTAPSAPANLFDPQATRDNLFGHSDNFNAGAPRATGTLTLTGLDGSGSTLYDLTFFSSRTGVTDNRETQYAVVGLNNGLGYLNASGNTSSVATVSGIKATPAGEVVVTITAGPNNSNGSKFFYLGAMRLESAVVPEPATLGLACVAALVAMRLRRAR